MKKLLLILLCLPLIGVGQLTYVPDDVFESQLEFYGMGNGIANDDYVFTSAIDTLTFLETSWGTIYNLEGIQDFTMLDTLILTDTDIDSLDLSSNQNLIKFESWNGGANSSSFSYLMVNNNLSLKHLEIDGNQLSDINISNLINLEVLWCGWNQNTSLDVTQNTALTYLNCVANTNAYQLTSLDVTQNPALTFIQCDFNLLTSLDVSQNPALTTLYCRNTLLTSLDVSQNVNLKILHTSAYVWFGQGLLSSINLNGTSSLEELYCSYNALTTLDLSNKPNLNTLECDSNQITTLDLNNHPLLNNLNCSKNMLTLLNVRNGNNQNMYNSFKAFDNPNLSCIEVDNVIWSTANWTAANGAIDPQHYFSMLCNPVYGCTDSLACNYDFLANVDDGTCMYSSVSQQTFTICEGDSVLVGNIYYLNSGLYTDTFSIANGCDSIVYTNIIVDYNTASFDTLSFTSSIVWNGILLSLSGDYSFTLINSAGCDSIVNLNLTITNTTGILNITNIKKTLLKISDILGREVNEKRNTPLFYIYDDGTVEKKIIIE